MPKIVFKTELRLPRQVILPLSVAFEAGVPRALVIQQHEIEAAEPIARHLQERHPGWIDSKPKSKTEEKPSATEAAPVDAEQLLPPAKLERLTIAQLEAYAAEWGIDLGDAKKHDDIVDVIVKALSDDQSADNA